VLLPVTSSAIPSGVTPRAAASTAVADDNITAREDANIAAIVPALGLTWAQVRAAYPDLVEHVAIAAINGGQLPRIMPTTLIPSHLPRTRTMR
jgi:hypothetical protein